MNTPIDADFSLSATPYWNYLGAAAVLTDFQPHRLRPLGGGEPDFGIVGNMLMEHGDAIRIGPAKGRWTLSGSSREAALAELKRTGALTSALRANQESDRPNNPTQRAIDRLIEKGGAPLALKQQSLNELLGLHRALEMLGPVIQVPSSFYPDLIARIEQLRLLEPLERLLENGFAGRANELRMLRSYVDELEPQSLSERVGRAVANVMDIFRARPLLVIWGPGGVGKSTLIAKFLIDHAGPQQKRPVPFVYLDCDQYELDPYEPISFLREALRQIQVQFPKFSGDATRLEADSTNRLASVAQESISRSAHFEQFHDLRQRFAALISRLSDDRNSRVLFFIDTFEVVQRRGSTPCYNILTMVAQLMEAMPRLRVVIAGRACLRASDFAQYADTIPLWKDVALQGFDADSGRAYLQRRLRKLGQGDFSPAKLDGIVALVRGNPLSLRLAAQLLAESGVGALEDAVEEAELEAEFTQERLQGVLHNRIILNLPERIRKVADPGLIIRRLTPEIIEQVLNEACGLGITSPEEASALFTELEGEITLFEPVAAGVLRHRPDVRLLMLPLLRAELGEQASAVDRAAVRFWSGKNSPEARAEEIYHLLWLNEEDADLDAVWNRGLVSTALTQETLDEFEALDGPAPARIWLCRKLDREMSAALEMKSGLVDWERNTERRVRSLLASGSLSQALSALRVRSERTTASPLWELEIETLKLLARDDEAMALAERALASANGGHAPKHVFRLMLQKAWLFERAGDTARAATIAARAATLGGRLKDPCLIFDAKLTLARLNRALGSDQAGALQFELARLLDNPSVKERLMQRPALLRETVAEIGSMRPDLLIWSTSHREIGGSDSRADVSTLMTRGVAHAQRGELDQAQQALEQARDIASQLTDDKLVARAELQLASVYLERLDATRARQSVERVFELAKRVEDPDLEMQGRAMLGNVYLKEGNFSAAIPCYEESLEMARRLGSRAGESNALGNLANAYLGLGNWPEAIELLENDLQITRELNNWHGERQTLGSLATAYWKQGDLAQARALYEQSLAAAERLGDMRGVCSTQSNLGAVLAEQGNISEAEDYLNQALSISRQIDDRVVEMNTLGSLAELQRKAGHIEQARELYSRQLDIAIGIGDQARADTTKRHLALLSDAAQAADDAEHPPLEADTMPADPYFSPGVGMGSMSSFSPEVKESWYSELSQSVDDARESTNLFIHQRLPKT
jgi:tetratricopeptide (TPR) repeat protein